MTAYLLAGCNTRSGSAPIAMATTTLQQQLGSGQPRVAVSHGPIPLWRVDSASFPWTAFTRSERAQILRIRKKMFPNYRRFLRAGLFGGPTFRIFSVFVSKNVEPVYWGAEPVPLNECHSTPVCKYSCSGEYVQGGGIGPLGPTDQACLDGQFYFYRDAHKTFPLGQRHVRKPYPCMYVNGQAYGSCPATRPPASNRPV